MAPGPPEKKPGAMVPTVIVTFRPALLPQNSPRTPHTFLYNWCESPVTTWRWPTYRAETCRCYNPPVILEANIVVFDCKYEYTKLLNIGANIYTNIGANNSSKRLWTKKKHRDLQALYCHILQLQTSFVFLFNLNLLWSIAQRSGSPMCLAFFWLGAKVNCQSVLCW